MFKIITTTALIALATSATAKDLGDAGLHKWIDDLSKGIDFSCRLNMHKGWDNMSSYDRFNYVLFCKPRGYP